MASKDMIEDLRERSRKALAMGGPEKLKARRAAGIMNARERIDYLLDPGSFVEAGLFACGIREEVRHKSPADGKIAGVGRIDGRPVALVSNDFTVLGASSSVVNMKKMRHMKKLAVERGMPLILLGESTGSRMPDRMGAAGRATLAQDPTEYRRLRDTPMISALLGECYGSSTWYSCISDFRVMRKGARMAVASGRVTSIAINQRVDPEELGGWRLHSEVTGLIVDKDSLFELKPGFGKPIVTALARLGGKSVGIVANNPKFKGGAIDVDSMQKATGFLVHCDSFNIPLVFYVDQPGFLIGIDGERRGAPGKIMNWMNALQLVTVPKVTVIARKNYGQAYLNMCGGHAADWVILWPMADLGFMDPTVGVSVLHNLREQDDPERFRKLRAELERDTSAWDLAALYEGHVIIDPRETRAALLKVLEVLRKNRNGGVGQHLLRNWPTSY